MSICPRPITECPDCGDILIHQSNRQEDESSSEFGQYVHDRGERDRSWREMYWLDVDGVICKKRTQVLRIIEHKNRADDLSDGQKHVLPLLAKALQLLVATRLIHSQSGVFVVYSDHPHDSARVRQIGGWGGIDKASQPRELTGIELDGFIRGDVSAEHAGG